MDGRRGETGRCATGRFLGTWFEGGWVAGVLLLVLLGSGRARGHAPMAGDPVPSPVTTPADRPAPPPAPWPTAIIVGPPASREDLIQRLRRPDLLLGDPAAFERWRAASAVGPANSRSPDAAPSPTGGIIAEVAITVRPEGPTACVEVVYDATLPVDAVGVVPLGLGGLTLGRVVEAGRDLPVRPLGAGWGVELGGRGEHRVEVTTTAPVRLTPEGMEINLAIPPAASTRVVLVADRPLADARVGPEEPLVITADRAGRAEGRLRPRARLNLTWRPVDPGPPSGEPMATARGEVLVRPGPDSLGVTETWLVTPLRGVIRDLVIPLDPDDGEVTVRLDDQPAAGEPRPSGAGPARSLHLPLAQPWTDGPDSPPHRVGVELRRAYPPRATNGSVELRVHPHPPAALVVGVDLGVAPSEIWQVAPGDHPGWVRTDPRSLLAKDHLAATSAQTGSWLGLRAEGQPTALCLLLDPVRPRFQARLQTAVTLRPDRAEVAATLAGVVERGRLFEARVEVPSGLRWEPPVAGPSGLVVRLDDPPGGDRSEPPTAHGPGATLVATFDPPLATGETFALGLRGSSPLPDRGPVVIPLFRPIEPSPSSTDLALVVGPERRVEAIGATTTTTTTAGGDSGWRRSGSGRSPEGWAWPGGLGPPLGAHVSWFQSERADSTLALASEPSPPVVRHHSTLSVAVDRRGAEVVEEVVGDVTPGTLGALDVALPPEIADRWTVEAGEGIEREPLGDDPASGWRRYRVKLGRASDAFQFRSRYRLDLAPGRGPGQASPATPLHLVIQPIAVLTGRSTGRVVRIGADPDIALRSEATGWTPRLEPARAGGDSVQAVREVWEQVGGPTSPPITLAVTPGRLADLPTTVASRLWLRSVQSSDAPTLLTARYRLEVHDRTVTVRLPSGSRWVRSTVGGIDLGPGDVEQLDPVTYRATLPPGRAGGPLELRIDAQIDDAATPDLWLAPELVGGAVQQTLWELVPVGTRVGVGVPSGWTDENRWVRRGLVWRREPTRPDAALARWIANEPTSDRDSPPVVNQAARLSLPPHEPQASASDPEPPVRYLFSHPGPPRTLRFVTLARSTLLLVCSGPVLLFGLLVLIQRPPMRWVVAVLLVVAFALAVALEAETALLVLESSALGLALMGIAIVLHQVIERRGGSLPAVTIDPSPFEKIGGASEVSMGRETVIRSSITPPVAEPTTSYPALPTHPLTALGGEPTVAVAPSSGGGEPR